MSTIRRISFTDLCLNGQLVPLNTEGAINQCEIGKREAQALHRLAFVLTHDIHFELTVEESLSEFKYGKWDTVLDAALIVDFNMALRSIPPWMSQYSTAGTGCVHRILATMKVQSSTQSNYKDFTKCIWLSLSSRQFRSLENGEALDLWNKRCAPLSTHIVGNIKFSLPNFQEFAPVDLERLKGEDKWLSDAHVTLALQDYFRLYSGRNIWGNLKIKLLDTLIWPQLRDDPDRYDEQYRKKQKLVEYDFLVIPMFEEDHWRLGIVEKPGQLIQGNTKLHILDSLRTNSIPSKEAQQIQSILLKHFEGVAYEGHLACNLAEVPRQWNGTDCGCFTILYAKKFLQDPAATMTLIKTRFSSPSDVSVAWGFKGDNVKSVRREIRALLFKYINQGEAVVE